MFLLFDAKIATDGRINDEAPLSCQFRSYLFARRQRVHGSLALTLHSQHKAGRPAQKNDYISARNVDAKNAILDYNLTHADRQHYKGERQNADNSASGVHCRRHKERDNKK